MVKQTMDEMKYERKDNMNILSMRKGIKHTSLQSEVFEKNYEESDEVIVVMKLTKVSGTKDRNILTFQEEKDT